MGHIGFFVAAVPLVATGAGGHAAMLAVPLSSCDNNTHVVSSHLVDASRRHGSVVEAQVGADLLQALGPVAPPPQVQRVVAPHQQVRHVGRQAGVQVGLVLAQARLSRQEPAGKPNQSHSVILALSSLHRTKNNKQTLN